MKAFLLGIGVLLFFNHAIAGNGSIEGVIIDKNKGTGIPGVNIYLEGTTYGNYSDGQGRFIIEGIEEGQYKLKISAVGYKTVSSNILINPQSTSEVRFELSESAEVLEGIIINRVSLTGGTSNINNIPGSAHYISKKELSRFSYSDVNRVLRNIPGLIIQEEDGFGLRPNIGMRGTGVERSSKITLMEDGILMAPAPYSAPAAYYFPSVGRMAGVEVRKGSSQIKYGPNTTGGAINFFSTHIPEDLTVQTNLIAGSYGYHQLHSYAGKTFKNGGILAETFMLNSDGFKDLDDGGNTGFNKEDYLIKGRINTNPDARIYQALNFKLGLTEESSNETYLGLTDADFVETPYRRYAGSQTDNMQNRHQQWHLRHLIQPLRFMDITTTYYRNEFERNWYKLDKVKSSDEGSATGISNILSDPQTYADELAIIKGISSANDDALSVKANNRSYLSQGVESIIGFNFNSAILDHELEIGGRFHYDQMDRFQWVDAYRMADGVMQMTTKGMPGTDSNYLIKADALSSFSTYRLRINRFSLSTGLRYENINYEKTDYGKNDPARAGTALEVSNNNVSIFIPGIAFDYKFTQNLSSFAGIHKGFTPPGIKEGTEPEISWNYEAGVRFLNPAWQVSSTVYFNDYQNLLGADLAATGGTGTVDQFNGGESMIYGLEQEITFEMASLFTSRISLPLSFLYTFTHASFANSFESEYKPWGNVTDGDHLPYIPEHQLAVNLGIYHKRLNVNFSTKYVGPVRTIAGQGAIAPENLVSDYLVSDVSVNFRLARFVDIYGGVYNLTGGVYEVSRRPAGLRPGMPRNFRFGIKANIR